MKYSLDFQTLSRSFPHVHLMKISPQPKAALLLSRSSWATTTTAAATAATAAAAAPPPPPTTTTTPPTTPTTTTHLSRSIYSGYQHLINTEILWKKSASFSLLHFVPLSESESRIVIGRSLQIWSHDIFDVWANYRLSFKTNRSLNIFQLWIKNK